MRKYLEALLAEKKAIQVNFAASAGAKLVSISGTIAEVGDDYMILHDIYHNIMFVPFQGIAFIEIKK